MSRPRRSLRRRRLWSPLRNSRPGSPGQIRSRSCGPRPADRPGSCRSGRGCRRRLRLEWSRRRAPGSSAAKDGRRRSSWRRARTWRSVRSGTARRRCRPARRIPRSRGRANRHARSVEARSRHPECSGRREGQSWTRRRESAAQRRCSNTRRPAPTREQRRGSTGHWWSSSDPPMGSEATAGLVADRVAKIRTACAGT